MFEKVFKLKEHNTKISTEIIAGITTFFAMAYIIFVNPNLLSATGMDYTAVMIATCLSAAIGTFLTAFIANVPFAQAPGMGLNAYLHLHDRTRHGLYLAAGACDRTDLGHTVPSDHGIPAPQDGDRIHTGSSEERNRRGHRSVHRLHWSFEHWPCSVGRCSQPWPHCYRR